MTDTRAEGLEVFKDLMPGVIPDDVPRLRDGGFAQELAELSVDHVFGSLWTRPGLDRRSRSLVTLGALIATRADDELRFHMPIALRNGLTIEEIVTLTGAKLRSGAPSAARIDDIAPLDRARPSDITFLDNAKYLDALAVTRAGACLLAPRFEARAPERTETSRGFASSPKVRPVSFPTWASAASTAGARSAG